MCFLFKKARVEPEKLLPTSSMKISGTDLRALMLAQFPDAKVYISDKEYLLCSYNDIALFLAVDQTNILDYIPDEYDCDDYSYRLMGQFSIPSWSALAFGIVWTDIHALNCFITEDREFYFIEPQGDAIQSDLEAWQGNSIRFIIM